VSLVMHDEPLAEVASLDLAKAKRFLKHIKHSPFVTFTFGDDGELHVYVKGVHPEVVERITELVEQLTEERYGDDTTE
jgi:hypothetical protein